MSVLTSYMLLITTIVLASSPAHGQMETGRFQSTDWLTYDTLNLNLHGSSFDVAFFQDAIIFDKSAEGICQLVQMDKPDPANSRPLFLNKKFPFSPASFSFRGDYTVGYYTATIEKEGQRGVEKIFEMSIENQEVSGFKQLLFTGDPPRYLHPAVSFDGTLLVFSSDRIPTSGGLDLFVTQQTANGWSDPVNLGELINSSGHEWFPFLDKSNNLWFSSTGHSGYGGYDIFVCPFNGKDWDAPRNLGKSINGSQDELGFSVHQGNELALFSQVAQNASWGRALKLGLNEAALQSAGLDDASVRNISLVLQRMADPVVKNNKQSSPEAEVIPTPEPKPEPAQNEITGQEKITFRVQIISSLNEKSFPTVLIGGKSYKTYEYYYKGSYRITVGQFDSLKEANKFKVQCKNSGFTQAFVAAFRGNKRETDPAVFK